MGCGIIPALGIRNEELRKRKEERGKRKEERGKRKEEREAPC